MNDPVRRDILSKSQLEELLSKTGLNADATLVLYGDFNNWFAAFAFWILKYYQVDKVVLMNGGRKKWLAEDGQVTKDQPNYTRTGYKIRGTDEGIRTYLDAMKQRLGQKNSMLVDVRSPAEFTGEITAPPEYPNENAQRGGHIPGAVSIPWSQAVREDGTFKTPEELSRLYEGKGVTPDKDVVTYCRIGERSSFSWFVLKYLLGYPNVKNYGPGPNGEIWSRTLSRRVNSLSSR
jgi:thiosulfate/3-mercaptopyruvate sulfurtransferase